MPHPGGRVVELGAADAADFGEEDVGGARVVGAHAGRGEGIAEELFGGAVVGGGVEGADAEGEGALDDLVCWQRERIEVILGVEGRSPAD